MKLLLAIASVGKAVTGLLLLAMPAKAIQLFLGASITGAGVAVTRVAGIALISLGLACWPAREGFSSAARGMIGYSVWMTIDLICLGVKGESVGVLLWPAVALHAGLALLLIVMWRKSGIVKPNH